MDREQQLHSDEVHGVFLRPICCLIFHHPHSPIVEVIEEDTEALKSLTNVGFEVKTFILF